MNKEFGAVVKQMMGVLTYYPKFKKHYKKYKFGVLLNARTKYLAIVWFLGKDILVRSYPNDPFLKEYLIRMLNGYLETDIHTFLGMGWGKYSQFKIIWMILRGKIKVKGIRSLLKFQKIMKVLTRGKR